MTISTSKLGAILGVETPEHGSTGQYTSFGLEEILTYRQLAKSHLKMLVLTSPGERVMDPEFGVGIRRFLFEMNSPSTYDRVRGKIYTQVRKYLPYIQIVSVDFTPPPDNAAGNERYKVDISIKYYIKPLNVTDTLETSA